MAKAYGRPTVLLAAVMALCVVLCALVGRAFPALPSGAVCDLEKGLVYTLSGFERNEVTGLNRYYVTAPADAPELALISGRTSCQVFGGGGNLLHPGSFPEFYRAQLDDSLFTYTEDGMKTLRLDFALLQHPDNSLLYLTSGARAEQFLTWYGLSFAFGMGITFLMAVYGFSLWRRKRSEGYLAWFSAYTCSVFLWSLCSLPQGAPNVGASVLFSCIYDLSVILDMVICFRMCDLRPRGRWGSLATWRGVAVLMAGMAALEVLTPEPWPDIARFIIYAAGAYALVRGCAERKPGAWLLLGGYGVSFGLRFAMLSGILSLTHVNFILLALRYSKIFNLPFAFACMFFINRRFADKFTESEALGRELEEANRTLDAKVEERTAALVQQQEQRRVFMMNIFHDLRTPLFILRGCTEELEAAPGHLPNLLPIMEDRLGFVGRLTEDLFLMAKLEDGKIILETERVPLAPVLERVTAACRVESGKKGVSLQYSAAAGAPVAFGDELRLEQVFQNLISNAIYYTPEGGAVAVALTREGDRARVRVTDTGVGIAPDELGKLFERYYRVSGTKKHESTGLGLSIAQELVRLHRGEISVESAPGVGTTFTVSLPVVD